MHMNYLLQLRYTSTIGIRLYAYDIQYVYSEYALHTIVQQCAELYVMDLDKFTVHQIKT
jgi:hypothetical protein